MCKLILHMSKFSSYKTRQNKTMCFSVQKLSHSVKFFWTECFQWTGFMGTCKIGVEVFQRDTLFSTGEISQWGLYGGVGEWIQRREEGGWMIPAAYCSSNFVFYVSTVNSYQHNVALFTKWQIGTVRSHINRQSNKHDIRLLHDLLSLANNNKDSLLLI